MMMLDYQGGSGVKNLGKSDSLICGRSIVAPGSSNLNLSFSGTQQNVFC